MLKKMTAIGLALGLVLPGASVLAQTAQKRAETQERTEKQELFQKGSPVAGEQVQERERTRTGTQTREQTGDTLQYQKRSSQAADHATVSNDQMQDRDRTRDKDKDLDQLHDRDRDRDRIHAPAGGGNSSKGGRH